MNVGDYVRTPYGIRKVKSIAKHDKYQDDGFYVEDRFIICGKVAMKETKSSPNIIDLIEVGDYVNGEKVITLRKDISERDIHMNSKDNLIFTDYDIANNWYFGIDTDKIKSIVTKEQFESMEYKVGE